MNSNGKPLRENKCNILFLLDGEWVEEDEK